MKRLTQIMAGRLRRIAPARASLVAGGIAVGLVSALAFLDTGSAVALQNLQVDPSRGPHGFSCMTCHAVHHSQGRHLWATKPPGQTRSGTPLLATEALCYTCHKPQGDGGHFFEPGFSHPINVSPGPAVTVPPELGTVHVEGLGDVITCTSCHDPHGKTKGLLKVTLANDRLCLSCHRF